MFTNTVRWLRLIVYTVYSVLNTCYFNQIIWGCTKPNIKVASRRANRIRHNSKSKLPKRCVCYIKCESVLLCACGIVYTFATHSFVSTPAYSRGSKQKILNDIMHSNLPCKSFKNCIFCDIMRYSSIVRVFKQSPATFIWITFNCCRLALKRAIVYIRIYKI